jgi:hypothetical protein
VRFCQENEDPDQLAENDWEVLHLLLRILEVCIFSF